MTTLSPFISCVTNKKADFPIPRDSLHPCTHLPRNATYEAQTPQHGAVVERSHPWSVSTRHPASEGLAPATACCSPPSRDSYWPQWATASATCPAWSHTRIFRSSTSCSFYSLCSALRPSFSSRSARLTSTQSRRSPHPNHLGSSTPTDNNPWLIAVLDAMTYLGLAVWKDISLFESTVICVPLLNGVIRQVHKEVFLLCLCKWVLLRRHAYIALLKQVAFVVLCNQDPEPHIELALCNQQGPFNVLLDYNDVCFDICVAGQNWLQGLRCCHLLWLVALLSRWATTLLFLVRFLCYVSYQALELVYRVE